MYKKEAPSLLCFEDKDAMIWQILKRDDLVDLALDLPEHDDEKEK
jgi:hypothetical protein